MIFEKFEDFEQFLNDKKTHESENIITEEGEYKIPHTAPGKEGSPMHNLIDTYGEDIYTFNATKYFGDGYTYDNKAIDIIKDCRNKPNKRVEIYRVVPNLNKDIDKKLKELQDLISYFNKFNIFPIGNRKIIHDLEDKYKNLSYDDRRIAIIDDIRNQITELYTKKQKPLKINNGDWVTISFDYAKEHGDSNSYRDGYKILKKTVLAKYLYTDGNSIHEWGYNI